MRDFTLHAYQKLLFALQQQGFMFMPFKDFNLRVINQKRIILRHDVDAHKENSLQFALLEHSMGVKGTYFFRIVPQSFDAKIIKQIAGLGHEIGYHYETMHTNNGDIDKAYDEFSRNLEFFRTIIPVVTICMHGSPTSKYDNRELWRKYDYRNLGIIAEPYFDLDFNEYYYLTDTGRRWNGDKINIRDKSSVKEHEKFRIVNNKKTAYSPNFKSTKEIIEAVDRGSLPDKIMMTFHPQRWTDKLLPWYKELFWQNIKNVGKYFLTSMLSRK
jgi:hypothetical protein